MLRVSPSRPHLLVEVQARVTGKHLRRVGSNDHERHQADAHRAPEIERGQLRRHERMQCALHGPAAQQVHAAAAQLPGA